MTLLISNSSKGSTDSAVEVADICEFSDQFRGDHTFTFEPIFLSD